MRTKWSGLGHREREGELGRVERVDRIVPLLIVAVLKVNLDEAILDEQIEYFGVFGSPEILIAGK